jgi:hypothetical protein
MNWRFWGPLIFSLLLFVVGAAIKVVAFGKVTFYIDLGPELALWATGVLFSFAVSEQALFGGRTVNEVRKAENGLTMNFRVALPDQVEFNPRFVYLFVVCMAIWILDLLCAGKAELLIEHNPNALLLPACLIITALALAGFAVGLALRALREVG